MNRDKTLDYLRGLAVFQVIFVHVIYYLDVIRAEYLTVIKSFFLFEMMVFFFVIGAVNSLKEIKSYKAFCFKRIKGLMVPYYIYSAICLIIAAVFYLLTNSFSTETYLKLVIAWVIPLRGQTLPVNFFSWALWFVPVYILCTLILPVVKKIVQKTGRLSIPVLVLVFVNVQVLFDLLRNSSSGLSLMFLRILLILQETVFYSVFIAVGLLYPQLKKRKKSDLIISFSILMISVIGMVISYVLFGHILDMQKNKFPPNFVFLFYGFAFMSLLYLVLPKLKLLYRQIIKALPFLDKLIVLFSGNSIYVFLYHSFAFLVVDTLIVLTGIRNTLLEPVFAYIAVYPLVWITLKVVLWVKTFTRI